MAMANDNQVNDPSDDESKKDTVRINLPQGLGGKPPAIPTPTVRLKPAAIPGAAAGPVDTKKATAAITPPPLATKSKKDTAALTPAATVAAAPAGVAAAPAPAPAKTKKDTSRVAPTAAKPTVPEMPRPTVKLKREESSAPALPPMAQQPAAPASEAATDTATSLLDVSLAVAAMVLALTVAGYLFHLNRG